MALLFAISSLASCLLLLLLLLSLPSEAPPRVARTNDGLTTTVLDDDLNAATPLPLQYTETTMVVNTVKTIFIVNEGISKEIKDE